MNKKKYQTGIQKAVLSIIIESKKKKLPYIKKEDIIINLEQQGFNLKDDINQVGQALYQLQRKTKYRRPRIKKFKDKDGVTKGWTTVDDYIIKKRR